MIDLDFLEKVEVFKGLNDSQLSAVAKCGEIVALKRDEKLFSEGEDSKYLWIVMNGKVDLREESSKMPKISTARISFISESQTFGWSCFVPPYTYRLSGYCNTRTCNVVKFERNCLKALFESDPDIGYHVMLYLVTVVGSHFKNFQDEIAKKRGIHIMTQW